MKNKRFSSPAMKGIKNVMGYAVPVNGIVYFVAVALIELGANITPMGAVTLAKYVFIPSYVLVALYMLLTVIRVCYLLREEGNSER